MSDFSRFIKQIFKLSLRSKLICLAGLVLFVFAVEMAVSPIYKMKELRDMVRADSLLTEQFPGLKNNSELKLLLKEKAYKEALLKLSESDSIQLVVNLQDSSVNLSIKGVFIQKTKMNEFHFDKYLRKMPLIQDVKLFSQPLMVYSIFATIVKEPIVVRHAPKDTLEAASNVWQPDTLIQNPAFVFFELEHGIYLILEQDDDSGFYTHWKKFSFFSKLNMKRTVEALTNFVCLRKQQYHNGLPEIIKWMDDVRTFKSYGPAFGNK
jgi:hypothetical protein